MEKKHCIRRKPIWTSRFTDPIRLRRITALEGFIKIRKDERNSLSNDIDLARREIYFLKKGNRPRKHDYISYL
jgi:hypothetical protein